MNQETLNNYFGKIWKVDYDKFDLTGWDLLSKIADNETVLDVGCGYNLFKEFLGDRLHGIDPANNLADEITTIEDFETDELYDVALCLGSINFGDRDTIFTQASKTVQSIKPGGRIYWRQNPGIGDHPWKEVEETMQKIKDFEDSIPTIWTKKQVLEMTGQFKQIEEAMEKAKKEEQQGKGGSA